MDLDLRRLMDEAVALASSHHPHPNPRVGALVVAADGSVIGRGAHVAPGTPHAEIHALKDAGDRAAGATVFVTLEPCNHEARTPPCTAALIAAGVVRVVIGVEDPDPLVNGSGVGALRQAGIEVVMYQDPDAVEAVDPGYFHHRRVGRPHVTLKLAMTLDGQIAAADGTSRWITSEEARRDAHLLRAESDAVMVGAGTVLADDPELTVRSDGYRGHQPVSVVVAGTRPLPPTAKVFGRDPIIYAPALLDLPGQVVVIGSEGRVDLDAALSDLGARGVVDLLVEGGGTLAAGLQSDGLVDRYVTYLAGAVAGGVGRPAFDGVFSTIGEERRVEIVDVCRVGPDLRLEARSPA